MNRNPDLALYVVHVLFWASFIVTRAVAARGASAAAPAGPAASGQAQTAPFSRALLVLHMIGFGVLYFGIGASVFPRRVPEWLPGQRIVGTIVIALGAVLMSSALLFFRSWRFRAKLDEGHQLATGGPFRLVRHPIYMGINLLAAGTAVWDPSIVVLAGAVLTIAGSDLRARSEEALLERAFGSVYEDYRRHTKRFLPGIY